MDRIRPIWFSCILLLFVYIKNSNNIKKEPASVSVSDASERTASIIQNNFIN